MRGGGGGSAADTTANAGAAVASRAVGGLAGGIIGLALSNMHLGGLYRRVAGTAIPHRSAAQRQALRDIPGVSKHGRTFYLPALNVARGLFATRSFTNSNALLQKYLKLYRRYGLQAGTEVIPAPVNRPPVVVPPPSTVPPPIPGYAVPGAFFQQYLSWDAMFKLMNDPRFDFYKNPNSVLNADYRARQRAMLAEQKRLAKLAQRIKLDVANYRTPQGGTRGASIKRNPWEPPKAPPSSIPPQPPQGSAELPTTVSLPAGGAGGVTKIPKKAPGTSSTSSSSSSAPVKWPVASPSVFAGTTPWPTTKPPTLLDRAIATAKYISPLLGLIPRSQQLNIGRAKSGRTDPLTVPGTDVLTGTQSGGLSYASMLQAQTATATSTKSCKCPGGKRKKRGPKKPRTVCYKGSYTETATGLSKRKREQIPCN